MSSEDRSNPDWWDARYRSGDIPWDSGIVPPEVVGLLESGRVAPGWALDLGCGSGVTSRYLAERGFRVVGIDFSRAALRRATVAAQARGLPCLFVRGDATDCRIARISATFAVDIGCFHSFTPAGRASYRQALAATVQPGGYYLLYTFFAENSIPVASAEHPERSGLPQQVAESKDALRLQPESSGPHQTPSITYADIAAFAPQFVLRWTAHGADRARHSAWFLMQRACVSAGNGAS